MRRGILAIPAVLMMVATAAALAMPGPMPPKTYKEMSSSERSAFVVERARLVGGDLRGDGQSIDVSPELARVIRVQLDGLVSEKRKGERAVTAILARGIASAPVINAAFRAARLPTSLGIALAMSESEFSVCAVSPSGARGMFQFMPKTGERFGLDADALCDIERSATAAAAYHNSLKALFPGKSVGPLAAAIAYNTGEKAAEASFGEIARRDDAAAAEDFWRVILTGLDASNRTVLGPEGQAYLPRLFACAIVAETPGAFGVASSALSGL